jgi:hypothetical protein
MRKITIIGRGTVGCASVAHFLKWTDWAIDWVYDPTIEPAAVGEGTNLSFPSALDENLGFDSDDMLALNCTYKLGITKRNWGTLGSQFNHTFPIGRSGIHFNAVIFQEYVFNKLKNDSRINLIEKNIAIEDISSDYIMVCTGSPKSFDGEYKLVEHIPVNSCVVSQCLWDYPRFGHTLTYAMPGGWVFGIPLQNRCAIGYLYNDTFSTEDQIKEEVKDVLKELNLIPNVQRSLKFNNYYRKNNFSNRIVYNGNASFFLEPLEATSTGFAQTINRMSMDIFKFNKDPEEANENYIQSLGDIEAMISLHYFAGSAFKNDFWDYAQSLGRKKINEVMSHKNNFSDMIKSIYIPNTDSLGEVGTWPKRSFKANIEGLGIKDKLKQYVDAYNY